MKQILIFSILIAIFSSCSIEKRLYRSGFHISKASNSKTNYGESKLQNHITESLIGDQLNDSLENDDFSIQKNKENGELVASNSTSNVEFLTEKKVDFYNPLVVLGDKDCDIIILKDGTEIKANVLEINDDNIKYKMCDNLDGPTITMRKELIFMIKYPNGTNTVINSMESSSKNDEPIRTKNEDADKKTPSSAKWGLALSILGWFVPFFGSVILLIASFLSERAIRKINAEPNKYKGRKMANAASIISFIGIVVSLLVSVILLIAFL